MSTILITGASSGIGKATALRFADEGWKVIAAARDFRKAPEITSRPEIDTVHLDVSDSANILAVAASLAQTDIDVLHNNAGHMLMGPAEFFSDEHLQRELDVNLLGPIRVTRAFLPAFRARGGGLVINTTSMTAIAAGPFMSMYGATKAGLERWSFGLNHEVNPFGIRVKTIVPGIVNTNVQRAGTMVTGEPYNAHMERVFAKFSDPAMLDVVSTPEGTAAVVFEAATDGSDRIRYLTDAIAQDQVSMMDGFGEERLQSYGARAMFD
ncbi:SDR family NAD(P)-dependent oxidoreductase [Microbacterium sp. LS_15]|uniref:SDR family NAD(P)-dependent oxidoreductase n=1 Tax=Microbacterium sp. LS_15 TaxID=3055790 RepID=UPI0035C0CECD